MEPPQLLSPRQDLCEWYLAEELPVQIYTIVDSASPPTSAVLLMKQHDRPRINVMINFFIISNLRLFLPAWFHAFYPFIILVRIET